MVVTRVKASVGLKPFNAGEVSRNFLGNQSKVQHLGQIFLIFDNFNEMLVVYLRLFLAHFVL